MARLELVDVCELDIAAHELLDVGDPVDELECLVLEVLEFILAVVDVPEGLLQLEEVFQSVFDASELVVDGCVEPSFVVGDMCLASVFHNSLEVILFLCEFLEPNPCFGPVVSTPGEVVFEEGFFTWEPLGVFVFLQELLMFYQHFVS